MNYVSVAFTSVAARLARRKSMARESLDLSTSQLARVLGVADLTALGVGSTLGIGIYVLAGTVAKSQAGPATILSFFIAAVASLLAGLCFAELSSRVPSCGSAYMYCYVTLGEGMAFLMGWNLILEFLLSTSSVARGYSGYVDRLMGNPMRDYFREHLAMDMPFLASFPDLFALGLVLTLTALLTFGVRESTRFNNVFTVCNLAIVTYVIICGCFRIDIHNWEIRPEEIPEEQRAAAGSGGFLPFGLSGVINGAATCFFGFQGFDIIATASEEAQNPRRTIPLAICFCLLIVFFAYSGIAAVLTLMWPYYLQNTETPIPYAFDQLGWPIASWIVSIGTLFGLSTSLVGALFPMPRIVFAMAEDGLLFRAFARVNYKTLTPTLATIVSGTLSALGACIFDLQDLVDLMALSTLLVFALVAACIIVLRYRPEEDISASGESSEVAGLLAGVTQSLLQNTDDSTETQPSIGQLLLRRNTTPTSKRGRLATWMTAVFMTAASVFSVCLSYLSDYLMQGEYWAIAVFTALGLIMIVSVGVIQLLPQWSSERLAFQVPLVPLVPALSMLINIYLMVNLRAITWIQYAIYMVLGLAVYISYGWRNSKEELRMRGNTEDK